MAGRDLLDLLPTFAEVQEEGFRAVTTLSGEPRPWELQYEVLRAYPSMDPFRELTPCIVALIKAQGARLNSQHHGIRNLTLTVLQQQASSFESFAEDASTLCAASLSQMLQPLYFKASQNTARVQQPEDSSSILIVPIATLVVAVFIAFVGALYRYFSRGEDTAEYDYGTTRREDLALNLIHTSLFTYPSLISLLSHEDVPSSQRLLYPDTTRRSTPVQLRNSSTLSSVPFSDGDSTSSVDRSLNDETSSYSEEENCSIFSHRAMSTFWKASVPVLLAVAISIYISAQYSSGIQIEFEVWFKGDKLLVLPITDFTLFTSFHNMLKAQVYFMAGITFVWSGIWPYLRQGLLLFCWFSPTSLLSLKRRATLIHLLDITGKWCLVNLFSSTLLGVAFAFHVSTDTVTVINRLLPGHFLEGRVKLQINYGSYANVVATMLSLIAGHITIYFHRCALASDASSEYHFNNRWDDANAIHAGGVRPSSRGTADELEGLNVALIDDSPTTKRRCKKHIVTSWLDYGSTDELVRESLRSHFQKCSPTCETPLVDTVASILLPLTLALLVYAAMVNLCSFRFGGLVGKLLQIVDPAEQSSQQSMLSIVQEIGKIGTPGATFLELFLFLITAVLPLCHVTMLAILWFVPFTLKQQKIVYTIQEMCAAWVSVDVFLVNIIASVMQTQKFAKWMVGKRCPKKIDCFDVTSTWEPEAWTIFAALCLWYATDRLINMKADHVILHRERWVEHLHR